ncbi:MAG TPA: PAS domain S-box protein [Steroidobacteraceae bacterium]|nr:PAS domain S-box protein [Steroidobacteraceae bacterium]
MNSRVQPPAPASGADVQWLDVPGRVAAWLREKNWSRHVLGPPANWPRELQAAIQLLLSARVPAILFWGESRVQFFNDAFAATAEGAADATALAVPAAQGALPLWRRHWPWIEGLFSGASVRGSQSVETNRGVFGERATFSHMFVGDAANKHARGGLLLMLRPTPGAQEEPADRRRRAVLDAIDQGFCVVEVRFDARGEPEDCYFLEVNPAFERLTGIGNPVGRSMREIAPGAEQDLLPRYVHVARTGEPARFEVQGRTVAPGRSFDVFAFRVDDPEQHHVGTLFVDVTERRESAAALNAALAREREANALLDALSQGAPIGLAFVDREMRFRRVNRRLAEMDGMSAEEHIGKRPDEVLPGLECVAAIVERWREVLRTGEPWLNAEIRGETPAQPGVLRTFSENVFPVRVEGEIVGLGAVIEETTARRQAQDALADSESRFRALIELGPIGIALSDVNGRIELANDAFLSMLGYRRDEVASLNWLERTAPESTADVMRTLDALRAGQTPPPFEKDYIRRDGTRVTALIASRLLPGQTDRLMAYAIDITDRRNAERALEDAAVQLRRLIDNMAGFVFMLNLEGVVLEVGEPALTRGGLEREQVVGKKFWETPYWTYDPELASKIESWFYRACAGETVRSDVVARVANDGRMDVELMIAPVRDAQGQITHVILSGVDISERKRFEQALRENEQRLQESAAALVDADRRKDDFLATLAHELRNPLAPIRNGIQLLRLIASANPTLERTTVMMERQMQHLVRLVDDLLDVSRITRGKIELRREEVLVNTIVSSALESCESLFEPHGHRLSVVLEQQPLRVLADPDRLRQVFSNLLSNAAKFTPRGGNVWVELLRDDGFAMVKVRDSGIGIPPERIGQIFDMFTQVHTPQGNDGLGIGLALVKQLVALHGGTVRAHSAGPGKGSEFVVCLPLVDEDRAAGDAPSGAMAESPAPGRKILVVDDNVDAAESLAIVLRMKGHDVRTAHDGTAALRVAGEQSPDIVLLDLGMPGMDGLAVGRELRNRQSGHPLRIIALTGWGQESDRERTRAAGFDEHLVKPVAPELLLDLFDSQH